MDPAERAGCPLEYSARRRTQPGTRTSGVGCARSSSHPARDRADARHDRGPQHRVRRRSAGARRRGDHDRPRLRQPEGRLEAARPARRPPRRPARAGVRRLRNVAAQGHVCPGGHGRVARPPRAALGTMSRPVPRSSATWRGTGFPADSAPYGRLSVRHQSSSPSREPYPTEPESAAKNGRPTSSWDSLALSPQTRRQPSSSRAQ